MIQPLVEYTTATCSESYPPSQGLLLCSSAHTVVIITYIY